MATSKNITNRPRRFVGNGFPFGLALLIAVVLSVVLAARPAMAKMDFSTLTRPFHTSHEADKKDSLWESSKKQLGKIYEADAFSKLRDSVHGLDAEAEKYWASITSTLGEFQGDARKNLDTRAIQIKENLAEIALRSQEIGSMSSTDIKSRGDKWVRDVMTDIDKVKTNARDSIDNFMSSTKKEIKHLVSPRETPADWKTRYFDIQNSIESASNSFIEKLGLGGVQDKIHSLGSKMETGIGNRFESAWEGLKKWTGNDYDSLLHALCEKIDDIKSDCEALEEKNS